jgi:hypothetical protein
MTEFPIRLRELSCGVRVGIACLVLTILGGFAASAAHLFFHHENRDEQPGVSVDDIKGAYHGVQTTSPLFTAIERGHPETLKEADRTALMTWLTGGRITEDYDNLDLGDSAPVEIISRNCLECHARSAAETHPIAKKYPLDFFDDVKKISVSRRVDPVDIRILAASTHTHALALATLSLLVTFLLLATSWNRRLVSALACTCNAALLLDLAAWWLARHHEGLVFLVIGAGGVYSSLTGLSMFLVLLDLALPKKAE